MRAGMGDEIRNFERNAASEFFYEEIDALFPQGIIWRGEVDEVAVVANGLGKFEAVAVGMPVFDSGQIEGFGLPLLLVFGENLDGVKAEFFGFEKGVLHAAGDGEMGTEHKEIFLSLRSNIWGLEESIFKKIERLYTTGRVLPTVCVKGCQDPFTFYGGDS